MSHVNLDNARGGEQKNVMEQIVKDNVCPFCPENLKKYHKEPIISETDFWTLTKNQWPYDGADLHLLLILKNHKVLISDLSQDEWSDLHEIITHVSSNENIESGSFLLRFGASDRTGATVDHLHAHLISTNPSNKDYKQIMTRVG